MIVCNAFLFGFIIHALTVQKFATGNIFMFLIASVAFVWLKIQ